MNPIIRYDCQIDPLAISVRYWIIPVDDPLELARLLVEQAYQDHHELAKFFLRENFREIQKGDKDG